MYLGKTAPPHPLQHKGCGRGQFLQIDAGGNPQRIHQIDHILRGHVAAGPRGVGTATQPARPSSRKYLRHALTPQNIGQSHASGIVKMQCQIAHLHHLGQFHQQPIHLSRRGDPDGIPQDDLPYSHP